MRGRRRNEEKRHRQSNHACSLAHSTRTSPSRSRSLRQGHSKHRILHQSNSSVFFIALLRSKISPCPEPNFILWLLCWSVRFRCQFGCFWALFQPHECKPTSRSHISRSSGVRCGKTRLFHDLNSSHCISHTRLQNAQWYRR